MSVEIAADHASFGGTARFDVVSLLGRGANGIVYRVLDRETGRELALKTLSSSDAEQTYHLKAEFRSLAQLTHPHLVQLEELFVSPDDCYFTMELVDGTTFTDFVRELRGDSPAWTDAALARLCDVTAQLVSGISTLHAAGKLHRDIKPSNILVTRDGRAVLVDFGLCTELRLMTRARHHLVGTLLYMAPEQAWGKPLTAAADWYAFGAVIYEALAGRLPFASAAGSRILFEKEKPPAVPTVGGALAEVAAALVHPDPARRPAPASILEATRARAGRSDAVDDDESIPRSREQLSPQPPPFLGRNAEMSVLEAALHEVVRGRPAVVDVQGASGMGKTELVDRFVASVSARAGTVVLRGRCHPQESVSYNGFDGIIDDLSEWLRNLSDSALGDVLPADVSALYSIFPVLGRIPAIARTVDAEATEPYAMRQRAFRALRDLLARIGELYTMVVTIDDLQWGGADTAALLTEVFRAPQMPRSLLVLSYRSEDQPSSTLLGVLREQASDLLDSVHQIALGPIDHPASCELATHLLGHGAPDLRAAGERIAREAAGHPLYLRELALAATDAFAADATAPAAPRSDLRVLLRDRISRLEHADRHILELAAVGGRPLPRRILLAAAGPGERSRHLVVRLARQRLLRETVVAGEPAVEPYHSHVREAVLVAVAEDERQSCHRALADTLLREPDPDVDSLVDHLLGAGDRAAAARFAETAADRAARSFAFDRAVQLYRLAVDLTAAPGLPSPTRRARSELRTHLAAALANAGRSREAAEVYAAASLDAALDAPEKQADLARHAAEHYLRAGDLEEGFARLRRVLADVAVPYPASPASAVATMIALRARLAVRGLELPARPRQPRSAAHLARVDACWSAGLGHAWVDPIRAAAFQARYMMLALDSGEPTRVARGLATEASQLAAQGGTDRTRRARDLLTRAARMAQASDDRESRAFASLMAGSVEFYASRWREAVDLCETAETILRERQSRSEWELMTSHALSLASLAYLGDLRTLRARQTELLAEARRRGNLLAAICLASGVANIRWLAADDPDEAQRRADESLEPWKEDDFRFPQYLHLLACVNISLYRGDPGAAWKRLWSEWPRVLSSMSFHVQNFRVTLQHLRARCALALVSSSGAAAPSWPKREALLYVARRDARHLATEDVAWASALAAAIEGGIAAATGDRASAIGALAAAAKAYRGVDMTLHAAAADHERSRLVGGDAGRDLLRRAEAIMIDAQVSRSESLAAMLIPGAPA